MGFGKTVVLRMIAAVAEGSTAIFEHTPFEEFCLTLEDGRAAIVRRRVEGKSQSTKSKVVLEFMTRDETGKTTPASASSLPSELPTSILQRIDKYVPSPYHVVQDHWVDDDGDQFSLAEILKRFPRALEALPKKYRPTRFLGLVDDLEVFFVETNRLDAEHRNSAQSEHDRWLHAQGRMYVAGRVPPPTPRVKQYSEDILQRIGTVLADYARRSQESDRTFPERLVSFVRDRHSSLPEREILSQMADLENKRRRLISLGLLDSESGLRGLTEDDVRRAPEALTIYVADVQQKLNVFDDIAHRIGSLMDIVNDRFRYKRLSVERQRGFRVTNDSGQPIQLEDLSSGEQHELVVLYELLFRAPKNGLILVDEPEISLHVAWQTRFLSDLIGILQLTDAYAIVATHSPTIIGTRWDLTEQLKGPDEADGGQKS